jgi:glycosyltransferase involved in cell wall biosynthesis
MAVGGTCGFPQSMAPPPGPATRMTRDLRGLRLGLDARAGVVRGTGVATYRSALAETLEAMGVSVEPVTDAGSADAGGRLGRWARAAARGPRRLEAGPDGPGRTWTRPDLFREAQVHFNLHGRLLRLACADPPPIMHWAYPLPLHLDGAKNVYTVHDAIPLDHPELTGVGRRRHRRLLAAIGRSADQILTVSEASRAALEPHFPSLARPIVNTYQALPRAPDADAPLPSGLKPGGYVLFCGQVEPRKNLARLVAAHRSSGLDLPLVVAGPDGWRAASALPGNPSVVRLPWIERPQLTALIRHARCLAFPSLAEGFGLPVLEAMALGTPVVASNQGALQEIAGDAALTVDPEDIGALAAALRAACLETSVRERLRRAGPLRAAAFDPARHAMRLAEVYARLLA